ncbi:hypothetical protein T09_1108 [Trichinella sp. T9]|nr:hypothetical protein T09_1108 [Trichinella sp. T9]
MEMNETFSVTPSSVETVKELKHSFQVVSRWKAIYNETPVEFIPAKGKTRQSIPLILIVSIFLFQMLFNSILNIKKAIAVFQLHAFETIVILSLVAMETAAIFPYSLQTDQQ